MLRKLLRYDFKAILKFWWIAALSSAGLSLLGGWCITIFNSEKNLPQVLEVVATLLMTVVVLGLVAFSILSTVVIFTRFYKNLFTDEGYLTFTLPVKRSQLLNSKLIASTVTIILTVIVLIFDILLMLAIGFHDIVFAKEFWSIYVHEFFSEFFGMEYVGYCILYIAEALILLLLYTIFSNLFMFCCITVASIIAKKAKVLTAIGIYYAASSVFSFVLQMFFIFGISSIDSWICNLSAEKALGVTALIELCLILFISIFCGVLYSIQYWMLDRKLNLS